MFRFSRNHHQALSKNIKIHYIKPLKRVLVSQMFTINVTKTLCIIARSLLRTFGIPKRVLKSLCNESLYFFREGLMMISRESKHLTQSQ